MSHTIGFLYCHVATLFRVAVQGAAMTPLISRKTICQIALLLITVASVMQLGLLPDGPASRRLARLRFTVALDRS